MKMEDSQLCNNNKGVGRRSNKDATGRNAGQEQRFPATDVRGWWRKVSGCSLQAVCRAKTTKYAMVWSFLPEYQTEPKSE